MIYQRIVFLFMLASVLFVGCQGSQKKVNDFNKLQRSLTADSDMKYMDQENAEIQAIYFHATRRCATCEAVESTTKEALSEYYGEKISFQTINRDDDKENPMIEKYKISGQTLLIIKDDEVVNLTNDAFMNARSNPDKFKAKIKSTIDSML